MDLPLYFISDVHLALAPNERGRKRQERLIRFLRHIGSRGGTLFIVGDLFDFYFEYPHVIPKMYFHLFTELHHLKQNGMEIHYVLGNHDYWVQEFITETITTKTYFTDMTFELAGKKFYVTHGDGIISWDRGYRLLKKLLRNRLFVWSYRWLHPTLGYKFAFWVSRRSHQNTHTEETNRRVQMELKRYATNHASNGYDFVVSGHYHQVAELPLSPGKLVILGDWVHNYSYGYFDGHDLVVKRWESDA
jgi:UDP-2,3-diacylglucosamine hydrolase